MLTLYANVRPTKFSSVDDFWVSLSKSPQPRVIRFEIDRVDEATRTERSDDLANFVTFVGRILLFLAWCVQDARHEFIVKNRLSGHGTLIVLTRLVRR